MQEKKFGKGASLKKCHVFFGFGGGFGGFRGFGFVFFFKLGFPMEFEMGMFQNWEQVESENDMNALE